jgi:anti-sigma factor RsiW
MSAPEHDEAELSPEEAELCAYVDGELDEAAARSFERKMAADRELAARVRVAFALSEFVRDDGHRVYADAGVDGIADEVMTKLVTPAPTTIASPVPRLSAVPLTQVPATAPHLRRRKSVVIWASFGAMAAAAAVALYATGQFGGRDVAPVALGNGSAPATVGVIDSGSTVARIEAKGPKNPVVEPHVPAMPVDESAAVEVRDLEVGEGATVIYTREREDGPSSATVWIEQKNPGSEGAQR